MIWRRDNSLPSGRICSNEGRPIHERRRNLIARFKEVAMWWKCPGSVSAEMSFDFGLWSCRRGSNQSIVLYARQGKKMFLLLRLLFLSENSVKPISTLANNKRSCSKKWEICGQNCVFSVFPTKILSRFCHDFVTILSRFCHDFVTILSRFCHDFVTPFSTSANNKVVNRLGS